MSQISLQNALKEEEEASDGSLFYKAKSYFNTNISLNHADIPIIACCLVSGLCDSSVYASWDCFVSMQTGNTIFLALSASNQPSSRPFGWVKSLTSILFFVLGCLFFSQTRRVGPHRRGTLGLSFLLQSLCIFTATALVQSGVVPGSGLSATSPASLIQLLPLAFLAFQSGGQIVTSRLMGFNEVPTTVLTSVYCDLISDPLILMPISQNVKRNRRACAVVTMLIGGIAGGWLTKSNAGIAAALWISGGVKLSIAIGWSLWKGEERSLV